MPRTRKGRGQADLRPGETGTSPQHRTKSHIHHMVEPGISDDRALKVAETYPGRSAVSRRVYRCKLPENGIKPVKKNNPGITWLGVPVNDEPGLQGKQTEGAGGRNQ
jgi:hypothetical protein